MSITERLTEEEAYLVALLQDTSGVDIAEFLWQDPTQPDNLFRCWSYQVAWYRNDAKMQIDQCVSADTLIFTERGHIPIQDVEVGDRVLTHLGRYRAVTAVHDNGDRDVVSVKGQGHPGLRTTDEHQFFTRKAGTQVSSWSTARDLTGGDRWATPVSFPATKEIPPFPPRAYGPGRPDNLPHAMWDPDFMWFLGLFIADGSTSSSFGKDGTINRSTLSVHDSEVFQVTELLDFIGLRYNCQSLKTGAVTNIVINSRPLATWLKQEVGRGASHKRIPPWVFGLDEHLRQAVLEGLIYGDGCGDCDESGTLGFTTTSRSLAFDMKMLACSLGYSVSIWDRAPHTEYIDGRALIGKRSYGLSLTRFEGHQTTDLHRWYGIKSITPAGSARVFDLTVEEDHSYVAESVIVHNCGRSIGKSVGIQLRAFAFPFNNPGAEMLITAPELIHLDPVTKNIEDRLLSTRLSREMLNTKGGHTGFAHRPFETKFTNGAKIVGRIPQKDGKGVKGCLAAGSLVLTKTGMVADRGHQDRRPRAHSRASLASGDRQLRAQER